jgi:site-specific DNA recombinase
MSNSWCYATRSACYAVRSTVRARAQPTGPCWPCCLLRCPGCAVLATAIDLLNRPRDLYNTATDHARKLLNKAIFTQLYLDTDQPEHHPAVTTDDLNEPFASLVHAVRTTNPARPPRNTRNAPHGPTTHLSGLLASALTGQSASKAAMVELTGFEPVTPALPVRCATSCATAPKRSPRLRRGA